MKQKFYWTTEKEEELKKLWNDVSLYKLAAHFHTIEETIIQKAKELNLPEYKSNRWTKEEENLLREYAPKYVTSTIAKKLGRSYIAVQKKALKLGVELHSEVDPWKKWMIEYLKENINKKPIGEIQDVLGLSYHKIITKCNELGIEYVKESWTEEEIETLRKYAQTCHYTELTKVLPRRSVGAISAKAYELGIETISEYTKLTKEQLKYITDNWGKIPATEIARNLRISIGVLNRYKRELNLPNTGQQVKWTDEVVEKVKEDAKTKTIKQLAKKYNTSKGQISKLAYEHNFKLIDSKKIWNEKLDAELTSYVNQKLTIQEISVKMGIKANTVRQRIKELGLSDKKVVNKKVVWTEDDVKKLKELANKKTISEIAIILNKTKEQVKAKAQRLGIPLTEGRHWTEDETKELINLHGKYEMRIIAKKMNRSENTIRKKAKELGLSLKYEEHKRWMKEEELLLTEYLQQYTIEETAFLLERSVSSVNAKAKSLGLSFITDSRYWKKEEVETLKTLAKEKDIPELVLILKRSYGAISNKLNELGINANTKSIKLWTEDEDKQLLELLSTHTTFEIAKILDRSEESISVRAKKLGADNFYTHRRWNEEDDLLLSDLWGTKPIEYISKKINRTTQAIINRASILGLGSQISNNYEGLTIQDISDLFLVNRNTILTSWVVLGLKLSFRKRSNNSTYSYVTIEDLFDFLKVNQNIWDSRLLEKNILGKEPEWLLEKRKQDNLLGDEFLIKNKVIRQQLLLQKKYYLELANEELNLEKDLKNEDSMKRVLQINEEE